MRPLVRLGAESPFGLALPSATPTASQLYAPRGVWLDEKRVIVADSGNHRVLIWHRPPTRDGAAADVVLGQPDFEHEGAKAGGADVERGLHLPTGVAVIDGRLVVADAWHHRLLVWHTIPSTSYTRPDVVIGQASLLDIEPNRGGDVSASTLYWPYGFGMGAGWFWIADTGNRRVLGWPSLPLDGEPAHVVLGQSSPNENSENRGGDVRGDSFRWPHAVAGDDRSLYIADAGNHRIVGWTPRPMADRAADLVLGQRDFVSNEELPHRKQGAHRLRFPYALASGADRLAVADTANNRILLWRSLPRAGVQRPADAVLGQLDFDAAGENRWKSVGADTLCWPYGIAMHGNTLAIADSGNNRVVIWSLEDADVPLDAAPSSLAATT
ncbi:MAG: NHL repeat-containing protein [Gemmatimonadaceae bacterium]